MNLQMHSLDSEFVSIVGVIKSNTHIQENGGLQLITAQMNRLSYKYNLLAVQFS